MALLVKFYGKYSDEFDCCEFVVYRDAKDFERWKERMKVLFDLNGTTEFYFGTNEMLTYENLEDVMRDVEVIEITDIEFQVFQRLFHVDYMGMICYGLGGVISCDVEEMIMLAEEGDL